MKTSSDMLEMRIFFLPQISCKSFVVLKRAQMEVGGKVVGGFHVSFSFGSY